MGKILTGPGPCLPQSSGLPDAQGARTAARAGNPGGAVITTANGLGHVSVPITLPNHHSCLGMDYITQ
jgi:hypothetical protein